MWQIEKRGGTNQEKNGKTKFEKSCGEPNIWVKEKKTSEGAGPTTVTGNGKGGKKHPKRKVSQTTDFCMAMGVNEKKKEKKKKHPKQGMLGGHQEDKPNNAICDKDKRGGFILLGGESGAKPKGVSESTQEEKKRDLGFWGGGQNKIKKGL